MKMTKKFPIFDTMEDAVSALSNQWRYRKFLNRVRSGYRSMKTEMEKAKHILSRLDSGVLYHPTLMTMELLEAYGIKCELPVMAHNLEEARLKAGEIGYPVVMKIGSADISHKTDVKGVRVNIADEKGLIEAFIDIMDAITKMRKSSRIHGVILQKMIPEGMELIIGGKHDHDFGPIVMFGMGGIFVE
ncbi:hypothetical protein PITCH_A1160006 [uncultured Desulfobacterium sp.]|uniref:ATP-grasp domain-containing protein n=1 Tax=uncultured Desulfobacterium sp. TaxID=201089 RepID=A0A445MRQ8_9BACT|nr:hypothetical protein PITCH_A1160006 [uncultured Desulfobacterium sp.]